MKKYLILVLLLFTTAINLNADTKPRFYLTGLAAGDSSGKVAEAYLAYFETQIFNQIKKIYPCAGINSLSTVKILLDHERMKQLLGTGDENAIQNIAQAMGCDYLISFHVSVRNNSAMITAMCMDNKKAEVLARTSATAQHGAAALNAIDNVTKQLFDNLKRYEICPFKGTIKVNIVSSKKDDQREENSVYCNNMDGTYTKTTKINNYSQNDWTIEKTGKFSAGGNVNFNLSEETEMEEINPCYDCSPTKQGYRTYYEKTTTYSTLQGLSNESESYGVKVDDARVLLTFLENGTYTISLTAASTKGQKKTKKQVHAEGNCDMIQNKPETLTNNIDEGLREVFGPFQGNAQDKILSHNETIKKTDPNSKEESVITYEYTLERD